MVLIVEDERVSRRALAMLLSASGFETTAAESAEEALSLLCNPHHRPPRVALVDLNLPGMSGLDFICRLEQIEPDVRPVLMTAASDEVLARVTQNHDVIYLRKPLDLGHLLNVITHADQRQ